VSPTPDFLRGKDGAGGDTDATMSVSTVAALLLGPGRHEIGCDECFDQLDCYVELELTGADADGALPGFRAHLMGCPACREDYESLKVFVGGGQAL
jgi:hypothetical protein